MTVTPELLEKKNMTVTFRTHLHLNPYQDRIMLVLGSYYWCSPFGRLFAAYPTHGTLMDATSFHWSQEHASFPAEPKKFLLVGTHVEKENAYI